MAQVRHEFTRNNFSGAVLPYIHQAIEAAPASFQPPFLLAAFYANRLEEPETVRRAFEVSIARAPTNGRLHLEYAAWLYAAVPERAQTAENHLKTALQLEPELSPRGIRLLSERGVPPERWPELVPDAVKAGPIMLRALIGSHREPEALPLLRKLVTQPGAEDLYPQAARWARDLGDFELALEIGRRWQELETQGERTRQRPFDAGLFLAAVELQMGQSDAAYNRFRLTLKEVEKDFGAGSVPALDLICSMAYEYAGRGQILLAQSLFTEAAALGPRYAPATLGLARMAQRSGDTRGAIAHYERVLALDPGNEQAKRELQPLLLRSN
jgi:tetratricopeptide (TPR) repeat protein